MGLFGGTKIYVSSSLWNMAGNLDERTNYLKFLVLNGVLSQTTPSVASVITSGTLNGPRMNYQTFFRWAKNNYPEGMPLGGVFGSTPIDPSLVNPFIPVTPGFEADAELVTLDFPEYWNWAEAYVMTNHPDMIQTDWNADINETTHEITITFEDTTTVSFMPTNYDTEGKYIYARYSEIIPPVSVDPIFVSAGPDLGPYESEAGLLDTSNYYLFSEVDETGVNQDRHSIVEVIKTYSDDRPTVTYETKTVVESQTYSRLVQTYERYQSIREDLVDPNRTWWDVDRIIIWEAPAFDKNLQSTSSDVVEIEPGVFETTVTNTYLEEWRPVGEQWWCRAEVWEKDNGTKTIPGLFIYKIGDGIPELDALEDATVPMDGYFPMIPIRTNNKMVNEEPHLTNIYPQAKKAWKRASGGKKIDKLIEQVEDNPDLGDIDYAFLVWGVPLNAITRESKLYIYHFFKEMMEKQTADLDKFQEYLNQMAIYEAYLDAYDAWLNTPSEEQTEPPVQPVRPVLTMPAATTVRTNGQHSETAHYDFRLSWNAISEEIHLGKWKTNAKKNEVNIVKGDAVEVQEGFLGSPLQSPLRFTRRYETFSIFWQENDEQYRVLKVYGAKHKNVVYRGKSVDISSNDALDDGDDSGFLIPMHYSILKKMPIVWANQLCTEGLYIIFNCYVVVKKKWYETFLGQLLIIVAIVVVAAVFTGGASALAGSGFLGSNAAVGSMFGLSGVAGAVAGAVANAIAGAIITQLMTTVLSKLGPIGQIISAVFSIVMGAAASGAFSGTGFNFDIFLRADNLLKLTNATINAYSIHIQAKTADIYAQMRDVEEQYKKQKREIDQLMYELTGFSSGFDPMILTEVLKGSQESRDAFNQRTLMTGSDIAELTHGLIDSFVASSLDLESLKG